MRGLAALVIVLIVMAYALSVLYPQEWAHVMSLVQSAWDHISGWLDRGWAMLRGWLDRYVPR